MTNKKLPILVLIGGSGTNLQSLIDHAENSQYTICAVISHNANAYGLERAKQANIATSVVSHNAYPDRETFEAALSKTIDQFNPQLIVLAGFMRILSAEFVAQYHSKLLNIHPSLLPDYKGLNTHQRVIDNQEDYHGSSVHFVTADLDGGPIVAKAKITLGNETNAASLQKRVQKAEHWLYPKVVNWFSSGRLQLTNNIVLLDNQPIPRNGLVFTYNESEGIAH